MKNYYDEDDDYDYSPNELANLKTNHLEKFKQIVQSNLDENDTIEKWQQRNIEYVQKGLKYKKMD